jgi:two-component system, LytTR family, sensor kinase
MRPLTARRALKTGALLFAGWTVFGLLSSAHFFFADRGVSDLASFLVLADNVLVFYWAWALLTPVVVIAARRVARKPFPDWQGLAALAGMGIALVLVHGVLHITLVRLLGVDPSKHVDAAGLTSYAVRHGGGDLATFAVLVGVCFLVEANRRAKERELAAASLQTQLARADLELLRWHLHPHFLFNALNTVSTLVLNGQGEKAEKAINLISAYLRSALEQRADTTVSLGAELMMVERYVEIERLRFGNAMRLEVHADNKTLAARVPSQLIQPLVENAIMHGAAREPGSAPIRIDGSIRGDRLLVTVSNPAAPGTNGNAMETDGNRFGLRYVQGRMQQFYGGDARFDLSTSDGRTIATLDLPKT